MQIANVVWPESKSQVLKSQGLLLFVKLLLLDPPFYTPPNELRSKVKLATFLSLGARAYSDKRKDKRRLSAYIRCATVGLVLIARIY